MVGGFVDKEDFLFLRQFVFDKFGVDNIDCLYFNVFRGDLESFSDVGVWDFVVGCVGGEIGESKQVYFVLQFFVVKFFFFDLIFVFFFEVVVVFKILFSEDVEKLRVDGLRVVKCLNVWEGMEILEVELGGGRNGYFESFERIFLGFFVFGFFVFKGGEGFQNVVV